MEIFGFKSCDGDSPACIPWVTIGPFERSKGGVLRFKMLSTCNGFVSLGSTLGNSLGLTSKIGISYFETGGKSSCLSSSSSLRVVSSSAFALANSFCITSLLYSASLSRKSISTSRQAAFAAALALLDLTEEEEERLDDFEETRDILSGAPNENIVQNHLDITLLNVF